MFLRELYEEHCRVPVTAYKLGGLKRLWVNEKPSCMGFEHLEKQVQQNLVALNQNTFCEAGIDLSVPVITYAERYGGENIGNNGGGGRVLNIGDIQLKGVGANLLVGKGGPESHTYGGLDAQSAIKEIIYANLINAISPVGSQEPLALYLVDEKSGVHNGEPSWGVILVREQCLRPAHWLRAGCFEPSEMALAAKLSSDQQRIKRLYKSILKNCDEAEIKLAIVRFLTDCAEQYAFCRVARLFHSVASASNLSIDGKLMDVSESGFVTAGYNYSQLSDFYSEPSLPLSIAKEVVYLVKKHTGVTVDYEYLQEKYCGAFEQSIYDSTRFIFSIDKQRALALAKTNSWIALSNILCNLITSGGWEKFYGFACIELQDPLSQHLEACLFKILHVEQEGNQYFYSELYKELNDTIIQLYKYYQDDCSYESFITAIAIQTLKRCHLASFFYVTYISKLADDLVESGSHQNVALTIKACSDVTKWVYEDLGEQCVTLFYSEEVSLVFDITLNEYQLTEHQEILYKGSSPMELYSVIRQEEPDMAVLHYNFISFILKTLAFLSGDKKRSFTGVSNVF